MRARVTSRPPLTGINDNRLRAYLDKRLTLTELAAGMVGHEPYEIRGRRVVALTDDERKAKANPKALAPPALSPAHRTAGTGNTCAEVKARYEAARPDIEAAGPDALRELMHDTDALLARQTQWAGCQRAARMRTVLESYAVTRHREPSPSVRAIMDAAPMHRHAYLIGKGPSMDRLTAADFPEPGDPVVCCNEAVHRIEFLGLPNPVVCVQQDAGLKERCRPAAALWLVSRQAWKAAKADTYPRAVQYVPNAPPPEGWPDGDTCGRTKSLTAAMALRILAGAGYRTATLLAFDAVTTGDIGYAASIGTSPQKPGQRDDRFKGYGHTIKQVARETGIELEWL
jgi:hypothetical protein